PFPLTGPGAHPATIAPRVVVIDAIGTRTTYDFGAPGISSTLSHYAGATDPHTGYMQMWVPFTANLHEPGFIVRVEIRGAARLPGGGAAPARGRHAVVVPIHGEPPRPGFHRPRGDPGNREPAWWRHRPGDGGRRGVRPCRPVPGPPFDPHRAGRRCRPR